MTFVMCNPQHVVVSRSHTCSLARDVQKHDDYLHDHELSFNLQSFFLHSYFFTLVQTSSRCQGLTECA